MGSLKDRLQKPGGKVIKDPRPDLKEDHVLWERLLALAAAEDEDMAGVLEIFRRCGTRLVPGKSSYMYVLRPGEFGGENWRDREEYERVRDECLRPYQERITRLLKRL